MSGRGQQALLWAIAVLGFAIICLVAVSCGGGDGDAPPTDDAGVDPRGGDLRWIPVTDPGTGQEFRCLVLQSDDRRGGHAMWCYPLEG